MKKYTWYELFMDILYEKYPKKAQLAEELMDLLCIERESVYRRLRHEIPFPAHEVAKIASEWNISLDEIIGIKSGLIPFQMQPMNYVEPSKKDMVFLQKRVKALEHFKTTSNSEFMEVGNKLPRSLCISSLTLYRFVIFKWLYQYYTDETQKPFSQVVIPEKVCQEFKIYRQNIKHVSTTYFILDQRVFNHLVHNIQYFHSIFLISDDEKELLKTKLLEILDYMKVIAEKGCYPETGKKVHIYISHLTMNTNYNYYYSEKYKLCRIHAFGKFDICSYDPDMLTNFRTWMHDKIKASIQISETNERSRIEYFAKQRQIIEGL